MRHVCIGHAPPRFAPKVTFELVSPFTIEGAASTVIADDCLGSEFDGRVLSEYLQLFALAESWRGSPDLIDLFQYRRFLTPIRPPVGTRSKNGGAHCSIADAARLVPKPEMFGEVEGLVIGPVMPYPIVRQYAANHHVEDLMNFSRSMAESQVFSADEVRQFLNDRSFLVSPSIGIYPTPMLVLHLDLMKEVWRHFHAHYYVPREGYQRRVGGYLMERLQSFLVLATIRLNPALKVGRWNRVVIEDPAPAPPALSQAGVSST